MSSRLVKSQRRWSRSGRARAIAKRRLGRDSTRGASRWAPMPGRADRRGCAAHTRRRPRLLRAADEPSSQPRTIATGAVRMSAWQAPSAQSLSARVGASPQATHAAHGRARSAARRAGSVTRTLVPTPGSVRIENAPAERLNALGSRREADCVYLSSQISNRDLAPDRHARVGAPLAAGRRAGRG